MAFPVVLALPLFKMIVTSGVSSSVATEIGLCCFAGGILSKFGYDWYMNSNAKLISLEEGVTPFQKIAESFEKQLLNIDENIGGLSKLVQQAETAFTQADKADNEIDEIKLKINTHLESLSKSLKNIQGSFQLICQFGLEQKSFQQFVIEKANQIKLMQESEQELLIKIKTVNEQNKVLKTVIKEQQLNLISLFKINQTLEAKNQALGLTQ